MFCVSLLCLLAILITPSLLQLYPLHEVVNFGRPSVPQPSSSPQDSTHSSMQLLPSSSLGGRRVSSTSAEASDSTHTIFSSICDFSLFQSMWPFLENFSHSGWSPLEQGEAFDQEENGWLRQGHQPDQDLELSLSPPLRITHLPQKCCVHHQDEVPWNGDDSWVHVWHWVLPRWGHWCESWESRMDDPAEDGETEPTPLAAILGVHLTQLLSFDTEGAEIWMFQVMCHQQRTRRHAIAPPNVDISLSGCTVSEVSTHIDSDQSPLLPFLQQLLPSGAPPAFPQGSFPPTLPCPRNSWLLSVLPRVHHFIESICRTVSSVWTAVLQTKVSPWSEQTITETSSKWVSSIGCYSSALVRGVRAVVTEIWIAIWHTTGVAQLWTDMDVEATMQSHLRPLFIRFNEYRMSAIDQAVDVISRSRDFISLRTQRLNERVNQTLWVQTISRPEIASASSKYWFDHELVNISAVPEFRELPMLLLRQLRGLPSSRGGSICPYIFGGSFCDTVARGWTVSLMSVASAYGLMSDHLLEKVGEYPLIHGCVRSVNSTFGVAIESATPFISKAVSYGTSFLATVGSHLHAAGNWAEQVCAHHSKQSNLPPLDSGYPRVAVSVNCIRGITVDTIGVGASWFKRGYSSLRRHAANPLLSSATAALLATRTLRVMSSEMRSECPTDTEISCVPHVMAPRDLDVEKMWIEWWSIGCIYGMLIGSFLVAVLICVQSARHGSVAHRCLEARAPYAAEGRQGRKATTVAGQRSGGFGRLLVVVLEIVVAFLGCIMWSRGGDGFLGVNNRKEASRGLPADGTTIDEATGVFGHITGSWIRHLFSLVFRLKDDGLLLLCNVVSRVTDPFMGGGRYLGDVGCGGARRWTSSGGTEMAWWFYQSTSSFFNNLIASPVIHNLSHSCNMSSTSFPCSPKITSIPSLRLPTQLLPPTSPPLLPPFRSDMHSFGQYQPPSHRSTQPARPIHYSCYTSGSITARNFNPAHACYASLSPSTSPTLQCSFALTQPSLPYMPPRTTPRSIQIFGALPLSPVCQSPYSQQVEPPVLLERRSLGRFGSTAAAYVREAPATQRDHQGGRPSGNPRGAVERSSSFDLVIQRPRVANLHSSRDSRGGSSSASRITMSNRVRSEDGGAETTRANWNTGWDAWR
eukprot:GHVS01076045.1.p1 GENE.GHVS01076045.1~~GHVS01076045.1.p1  ORF type:complete len:1314 (-),score=119.87 GHVS01076045.1:17-3451(-)